MLSINSHFLKISTFFYWNEMHTVLNCPNSLLIQCDFIHLRMEHWDWPCNYLHSSMLHDIPWELSSTCLPQVFCHSGSYEWTHRNKYFFIYITLSNHRTRTLSIINILCQILHRFTKVTFKNWLERRKVGRGEWRAWRP